LHLNFGLKKNIQDSRAISAFRRFAVASPFRDVQYLQLNLKFRKSSEFHPQAHSGDRQPAG